MKIKGVRDDPESRVRSAIRDYLTLRGWYVVITHGNAFQSGLPDLYATSMKYGARWIEVKLPEMKGSKFTDAQKITFPLLEAHGTKVFILTGADEHNYKKLFKPSNLALYMNGAWD